MWDGLTGNSEAMNEVSEEIFHKIKFVSEAVKNEIVMPMYEHVKQDAAQLKAEMLSEWNMVTAMVKKHFEDARFARFRHTSKTRETHRSPINVVHCWTSSEIMEQERVIVKRNLKRAFRPLTQKVEEIKQKIAEKWEELRQAIEEKYPEMYISANRTISEVSSAINEQYTRMAELYSEEGVGAIFETFYYNWNSTYSDGYFSYNITDSIGQWYTGKLSFRPCYQFAYGAFEYHPFFQICTKTSRRESKLR